MSGSYKFNKFSAVQRVIANCDKASAFGQSKVINSPWGVFTMYKVSFRNGRNRRYYSLKGSKVFTNRGSLLIGTIKRMLRSLAK